MEKLSRADAIWNRACDLDATASSPGDRALAALLILHGLVMNGGVLHAVECLGTQELADAMAGYRFFGFDGVAIVLTDAKAFTEVHDVYNLQDDFSLDDFASADADFDKRYVTLIRDDSALFARFAAYLLRNPSDFAPLQEVDHRRN
jgi:hypothetical protein